MSSHCRLFGRRNVVSTGRGAGSYATGLGRMGSRWWVRYRTTMLALSLLLVLAPSRSWAQDDGAGIPDDARRTIQSAVGQGRIPHTVADAAINGGTARV